MGRGPGLLPQQVVTASVGKQQKMAAGKKLGACCGQQKETHDRGESLTKTMSAHGPCQPCAEKRCGCSYGCDYGSSCNCHVVMGPDGYCA